MLCFLLSLGIICENMTSIVTPQHNATISVLTLIPNSGTDIILWHGKTGKSLGHVDTNQLKNNMATISPNGRFIAAAAFTADVKVRFIV